MSQNLRWYTKALFGMDHVVRLAPRDHAGWDAPSPCEGWTARHVLGHVIAVQRTIEAYVTGATPTMQPMEQPDRHAGDDPAATWAATRDAVLEALDHPNVIGRTVRTYRGLEVVDEFIGFNVLDTTVHSWDLARALGVDDRLDTGLVERSLAIVGPIAEQLRRPHVLGPQVDLAPGAAPQAELLAVCGRRP